MRGQEAKVIYQDLSLLVLDKPSGWIVNSSKSAKGQLVLQDWIKENFDFPTAGSWEARSGIVHRLDKETSGILVVAKTPEAFSGLQRQFKEREVKKTYVALAHGKLAPDEGVIDMPLGRLPWRRDRFGILPGGRESKTRYRLLGNYEREGEKLSLVELFPETGRTHQIRVHLKHIGHPIVSDAFYAGRKTARRDRKWCPRLFLHASRIIFKHPESGKEVTYESKLANDLAEALATLRENN